MDPFLVAIHQYAPNPGVVLDIGTYDCAQSLYFKKHLPNARVVAFEGNPGNLYRCRGKGVELVQKAVTDYSGRTDFYQIQAGTNDGASSLYEPKDKILPWDPPPRFKKVRVPCIRIDDWARINHVDQIDAVWMDVQGAELKVLTGFGTELLSKVKVIMTEVETQPVYNGNPTQYEELKTFMDAMGFAMVNFTQAWEKEADVLYVQKGLL